VDKDPGHLLDFSFAVGSANPAHGFTSMRVSSNNFGTRSRPGVLTRGLGGAKGKKAACKEC
jgi:hypothetical protein